MMILTPPLKGKQERAGEELKETPQVKNREPWKQPFQLVPDRLEMSGIKRSFWKTAEG